MLISAEQIYILLPRISAFTRAPPNSRSHPRSHTLDSALTPPPRRKVLTAYIAWMRSYGTYLLILFNFDDGLRLPSAVADRVEATENHTPWLPEPASLRRTLWTCNSSWR